MKTLIITKEMQSHAINELKNTDFISIFPLYYKRSHYSHPHDILVKTIKKFYQFTGEIVAPHFNDDFIFMRRKECENDQEMRQYLYDNFEPEEICSMMKKDLIDFDNLIIRSEYQIEIVD